MNRLANISIVIVAIIHVAIMCLEMYPPDCPVLLGSLEDELGFAKDQGKFATPIVQNAGLFNGFLAGGLFWSLKSQADPLPLRIFFLSFIAIAGIFGAITLPGNLTLWIQTLPAAIAIFANIGSSWELYSLGDAAQIDLEASLESESSVAD